MTIYRVYFRRRPNQSWPAENVMLVAGKRELDRILGRKTPIAIAWEKAKLHTCGCGRCGPWDKGWCWFGSWSAIESGEPIEIACSEACRRRMSAAGERKWWSPHEPLRARDRAKRQTVGMSETERAALTRERRSVPLPGLPKDGKRRCRWCTGEITGRYAHLRSWHEDCKDVWLLHSDRDVQARFLADRDGHDCWDCRQGGRWWLVDTIALKFGWELVPRCLQSWPIDWDARCPDSRKKIDGVIVGLVCQVEYRPHCGPLEVDHEIPLWKVWHLPEDERRPFYGPKNLRLRCQPCHKEKSKREAAERAQLKAKGPAELT